ncbi:MAG: hypothetical protein U0U70_01810 [Chitinophagaceae bacterium]
MRIRIAIGVCCLFLGLLIKAQTPDSTLSKLSPDKYLTAVSSKAKTLQSRLDKKSVKALSQFKKQEDNIIRKISKIDSSKAKELAAIAKERYAQLEAKLANPGKLMNYIPGLDSMNTTLRFLNNSPGLTTAKVKVTDALGKVDELKAQLQKAEDIKSFLKERKQFLKERLEKLGFAKKLKRLNKQMYYYAQQLNECKSMLNDPKMIEKKALELLSKTKIWKDFFRKNSILASLFRIQDPDVPLTMASIAGLQTRAQVQALVQQQIRSAGPNGAQAFQQQMASAQDQLRSLQNKIIRGGGHSSDATMPEGFTPNNQKTKSFWQRLEYGTNLQTQKGNNYFVNNADLGLSVGYKLNDRSIIGIGASYKMGLGRGWNAIRFSNEGVGLRSFIDWKVEKIFWMIGGFEMNYKTAFSNVAQLQNLNAWQQSGLLGLSKNIPIKSKFFEKTKVQLLWDFLSYRQVPRTQPVLFRIGYTFK